MEGGSNPRLLFGKLFLLGIVAIGMIIGSVFWLTARIDRLERENGQKLGELMVTERVARLQGAVRDYAYWDGAYEYVSSNNSVDVDAEIGTSVTENGLFSHIVILDSDLNVLFAYDEEADSICKCNG